MPITELFQDSATISNTEYFLASDSTTKTDQTTDGIFQLFLEVDNLVDGDSFRLRAYERISSGGTARIVEEWTISNLQTTPIFATPALIFMHGWEFSLLRLSANDRSIAWSIRQVA